MNIQKKQQKTQQKTQIGKSELHLPPLGLGCGPIGGVKAEITNADAHATLAAAWDNGIRYFDTAPWYGNTHSEHRTGAFLREKPRDEFAVTTKVGRIYPAPDKQFDFEKSIWRQRWPGGLPFVPQFDFGRDAVLRSYEDSLNRLGLPYVDGLAIHDLDIRHQKTEEGIALGFEQLEKGGGYEALCELKASGDIKAIGAGINFSGLIPEFLKRFDIDYFILAMPYTLLDQEAMEVDLPLCEAHGASVLIGAPFASGILATGAIENARFNYAKADDEILTLVRRIEEIGRMYSVSLAAAALQFPLAHPAVAGIIPGAETAVQATSNCREFVSEIPHEYWKELKNQGILTTIAPTPAST